MTTITIPRALLEQALEALELVTDDYDDSAVGSEINAIQALRAELAKPVEPQKTDVFGITTAYEQGVGKGHQSKVRGEIACPYAEGDYAQAWNLGYTEGKEQADRLQIEPAKPVEPITTDMAVKRLCQALRDDLDYAWSWHCNVAMTAYDAGCPHDVANEGAARFMQILAGVDTRNHFAFVGTQAKTDAASTTPTWHDAPLYDQAAIDAAVAAERERCAKQLTRQQASYEAEIKIEVEAERARCAKVCDAIAEDKWALYEGRKPYTGKEPGRASDFVQGQSDGADQCADAIRKVE